MLGVAVVRVELLSLECDLFGLLVESAAHGAVVGPDGEADERGVVDGGLRKLVGLLFFELASPEIWAIA